MHLVSYQQDMNMCQYERHRRKRTNLNVCNVVDMADYVAAINIAARAAVKQHIVADLISSYKPPVLIGGS